MMQSTIIPYRDTSLYWRVTSVIHFFFSLNVVDYSTQLMEVYRRRFSLSLALMVVFFFLSWSTWWHSLYPLVIVPYSFSLIKILYYSFLLHFALTLYIHTHTHFRWENWLFVSHEPFYYKKKYLSQWWNFSIWVRIYNIINRIYIYTNTCTYTYVCVCI